MSIFIKRRAVEDSLILPEANSKNTLLIERFEDLAMSFINQENYRKAIEIYQRLLEVDPNHKAALINLADLYIKVDAKKEAKQIYINVAEDSFASNNLLEAAEFYRKVLDFDAGNLMVRLLLVDIFLNLKMLDQAEMEFLVIYEMIFETKDFKKLETILIAAIEKTQSPKLLEKLVECYQFQGRTDDAIAALSENRAILKHHAPLLKILKELYSGLNNNEKTEKLNEMIARTCHDEVDVILNQGKKHLEHGEYDKAYQLFLPVLKKMVKMKNFKTPISLLNLILTYNSDYLPAQKKLMAIYQFMGDKKGLNTLFDFLLPMLKFKKNKRDFIEIVLELSQLTDHPDQAEQQVARVREQKTSEIEHKLINTNLNIMKDLVKKGHYKVASGILEQLLRVYPNKIEVGIHPEKTDLPVSQAE